MRLLVFSICAISLAASVHAEPPNANDERRREIELEVVRYVVQSRFASSSKLLNGLPNPEKRPGRLYFLTTTPTRDWGKHGRWQRLPDSFHKSLNNLSVNLFPASEAQLVDRAVYRVKDGKEGWMYTVYVSKWISDTEVEVDQDLHRSPRLGSGTREIWIKADGSWTRKPGAPVLVRRH